MLTQPVDTLLITRWSDVQHPTLKNITEKLKQEGFRPYQWIGKPNQRVAIRSHGFTKVLFVVEGSLELTVPTLNQRIILRAGDRVDIPTRTRHGITVGANGVIALETLNR
jgi:quercetin dioxygenase-like cupin family protein